MVAGAGVGGGTGGGKTERASQGWRTTYKGVQGCVLARGALVVLVGTLDRGVAIGMCPREVVVGVTEAANRSREVPWAVGVLLLLTVGVSAEGEVGVRVARSAGMGTR